MKRRRWVVVGLAVLALATVLVVVSLRSASAAPFKFIHGRRVYTESSLSAVYVIRRGLPAIYSDFYVFPGSVEAVRKAAAKELASLGYQSVARDGSVWVIPSRAHPLIVIQDGSSARLAPVGRMLEIPPGSVVVMVTRQQPNSIERIQEWARRIGL